MRFKSSIYSVSSGSSAGTTWSHNRYGQYVRNRSTPVNPNSLLQQAIRDAFAAMSNRFSAILTDLQRAEWKAYAEAVPVINSFGDPIILTANAMYVRCNAIRIQAGLDPVDDGPAILLGGESPTNVVLTAVEAAQALSFAFTNTDDWAGEVGGALICYTGIPKSPTVNFYNGPYRLAKVVLGAVVPPVSPSAGVSPYAIQTGQRLFGYCRAVRADGRISEPFRFSDIVG